MNNSNKNLHIVALIPARSGSKGLIDKKIRIYKHLPLSQVLSSRNENRYKRVKDNIDNNIIYRHENIRRYKARFQRCIDSPKNNGIFIPVSGIPREDHYLQIFSREMDRSPHYGKQYGYHWDY